MRCCARIWSASRSCRSMAWRCTTTTWTKPTSGRASLEWAGDEPRGRHPLRRRRRGERRGQRRAPLARRRRAPVALPAGPHAGQEDGEGDDLLPGAERLHARQLDPDPARPVGLRQVRQARRRLQRRLARLADPQDPADRRPAQHRAVRRRPPRQGHRLLRHLRRPRLPGRGDLRRRPGEGRGEGRQHDRPPHRRPQGDRRGGGHRRRRARGPHRGGPDARRPARRHGREDHLQLLRGVAAGPPGGHRPHLEPRRRPAVRAVLLFDMTIDLDAAADVFAASRDGTVGLEEEFAVLDAQTLDMVPRFEELRENATGPLPHSISGELIASEIEIRSGRGEDFADAVARQRDVRRRLFAHAADHGLALGATGTHPWADFRKQPFIDTEHYRRVVDNLRYVAQRNSTFSLHVHVGVRDLDRAVRVCDRLRGVLPILLAVSASSTCVDGQDSGLHSARTQTFTKSFPRCGIPDPYGGWPEYRSYLDLLIRTQSIVEYTQVWWSVRPHLSFGTVEVRICDAQVTAEESEALAAVITACVLRAARDEDEGAPYEDVPRRLLEENFWRAIRNGMDGPFIDLRRGEEIAARAALDQLLEWSGADVALPALNGAQRQRRGGDRRGAPRAG